MATPSPQFRLAHQSCVNGIPGDVCNRRSEIDIVVDHQRLESSSEHVAIPLVTPVHVLRESAVHLLHERRNIAAWRMHEEMKVVAHQTIFWTLDVVITGSFFDDLHKL